MEGDRYLIPAEVAKITNRQLQTLANDRYLGKGIPYYKVGRSIRYKLSDVLAFMEQYRVEPEGRGEGK